MRLSSWESPEDIIAKQLFSSLIETHRKGTWRLPHKISTTQMECDSCKIVNYILVFVICWSFVAQIKKSRCQHDLVRPGIQEK